MAREREMLAKLTSTPAGRANKFVTKREARVGQLESDLQFLQSLPV